MLSATLPEIDRTDVGKHPLVRRLLKAIYNQRTPGPRYSNFWDADLVLISQKELGPTVSLTLKQLSLKTVLLLALASFMRVSEIAVINLSSVHFDDDQLLFSISRPRKSQSSGPLHVFRLKVFKADCAICPVACVRTYIERTTALRACDAASLFISLNPPHKAVGKSTIARWIKASLKDSGVDVNVFTAHSTRGAAASKAFESGVPCEAILAAADWRRQSTFHRFYQKRVQPAEEMN